MPKSSLSSSNQIELVALRQSIVFRVFIENHSPLSGTIS